MESIKLDQYCPSSRESQSGSCGVYRTTMDTYIYIYKYKYTQRVSTASESGSTEMKGAQEKGNRRKTGVWEKDEEEEGELYMRVCQRVRKLKEREKKNK